MVKTGEMLIRLPFFVVNLLGGGVPISPQMTNMITSFPCFSHFLKKLINMINMINISLVLSTFSPKCG